MQQIQEKTPRAFYCRTIRTMHTLCISRARAVSKARFRFYLTPINQRRFWRIKTMVTSTTLTYFSSMEKSKQEYFLISAAPILRRS